MAKEKAPQEYLVKSKLYRFVSYIFITIGIFVFCAMYVQNIEGKMVEALQDPMILSVFLIPFLPAVILTWLADRAEKKYNALTEKKDDKK